MAFTAVVLATLWTDAAFAQQSAVADALFQEGRKLVQEGNYEAACPKFRESDRLEAAVGTKFNLANCEEKRGNLATAWAGFRKVVQLLPDDDERRSIAQERADTLAPRVPRLTIEQGDDAPDNTTVVLDGSPLTSASFGAALPLDPGEHRLVVSAPGHERRSIAVQLEEGAQRTIEASPGPPSAPPPPKAPPPKAAPAPRPRRSSPPPPDREVETAAGADSSRTLAFALGGVGVAGLVTGAVAGGMVLGKKSTRDENCDLDAAVCNQAGLDAQESARTLSVVSNVGWVVGALGLGAGAYFFLTGPNGEKETALATHVGPGLVSVSAVREW